MNKWIAQYVKGCAKCQQNKNLTKQTKVPLYRIPTPTDALPFQIVAMDLITQLPISNGYDAILTIVDHGCTRAAVFLPCKMTITGQEVAKLYYDNVYRWFGLPSKVISDRDPRFTSLFAKALAQQLGIKQNVSSAFLLPSPRAWDFPPSIDGDVSHEDSPMELGEPGGTVGPD